MMLINYNHSDEAWGNVESFIESLIFESGAKRILEVGAGANPTFPIEFVQKHNLSYTLLDISEEELAKAPSGYSTVCADITDPNLNLNDEYDFIFSRMLAEHVKDGAAFHRNILDLLSPGGKAFHFFPTLYAPPFVVNRLVPERLAAFLLHLLQPGRQSEGCHAKFPAYYSWCRGPMRSQIRRFTNAGFCIDQYHGFFGHAGYYQKIPIIKKLHTALSQWLVKHPVPWLCSFAYVVLSKPD